MGAIHVTTWRQRIAHTIMAWLRLRDAGQSPAGVLRPRCSSCSDLSASPQDSESCSVAIPAWANACQTIITSANRGATVTPLTTATQLTHTQARCHCIQTLTEAVAALPSVVALLELTISTKPAGALPPPSVTRQRVLMLLTD